MNCFNSVILESSYLNLAKKKGRLKSTVSKTTRGQRKALVEANSPAASGFDISAISSARRSADVSRTSLEGEVIQSMKKRRGRVRRTAQALLDDSD